jgi:hypothetical protein
LTVQKTTISAGMMRIAAGVKKYQFFLTNAEFMKPYAGGNDARRQGKTLGKSRVCLDPLAAEKFHLQSLAGQRSQQPAR